MERLVIVGISTNWMSGWSVGRNGDFWIQLVSPSRGATVLMPASLGWYSSGPLAPWS